MIYTKKDLGSFKLHMIKTDKFKTITVRVVFQRPIVKKEILMRNVLFSTMLQSNSKYKNKRDLNIKTQDLYAADIACSNARFGNYVASTIYLNILNDKYTEKGNFEKGLEFLSDVIFKPDVVNNGFTSDKLDIIKENCRSALNSIKEDPSNYSAMRLFEEMDMDCPSAYRLCGYIDDLDNIDIYNLYEYYLSILRSDNVDIFVIGDINEEEVYENIKKYFKFRTFKKTQVNYLVPDKKAKSKVKVSKELIENSQSKLAIGYRLYGLSEYERRYPLTLFNIIFGGGTDSKLFKEVREENSLCYTIGSSPNKLDNILIVRAGIDRANYDKTIEIIAKDLEDMRKGKFEESDISIAKEYFETAVDETLESPYRIIDNYLFMEYMGTDSLDEKLNKMMKVTKKEIVKVAKKVKIDTIFLLEGGSK